MGFPIPVGVGAGLPILQIFFHVYYDTKCQSSRVAPPQCALGYFLQTVNISYNSFILFFHFIYWLIFNFMPMTGKNLTVLILNKDPKAVEALSK